MGWNHQLDQNFQRALFTVGSKFRFECPQEDFDRLWRGPITDVRLREGFFLVEGIFGQKKHHQQFSEGIFGKGGNFLLEKSRGRRFQKFIGFDLFDVWFDAFFFEVVWLHK